MNYARPQQFVNPFGSNQPLPHVTTFDLDNHLSSAPILREALRYQFHRSQLPAGVAVPTALAAISTACQGLINVPFLNVETPRPASLYLLTIAPSGSRKSTAQRIFFRAIRQLEREKEDVNARAHHQWELDHRKWKTKLAGLERDFDNATKADRPTDEISEAMLSHKEQEPRKPTPMRSVYDDTTLANLYEQMETNPNAALIPQEGSSLFAGATLHQINKIASLWDGDSIHIERKDPSRSALLRDPRVTILLGMQPEILRRYLARREEITRGSGLWSRFLIADTSIGPQALQINWNTPFQSDAFDHFENRIRELLLRYDQEVRSKNQERTPVTWSPNAEDDLHHIHNEIQAEALRGRFLNANDLASKLTEQIARVAALLNLFEAPDGHETQIHPFLLTNAATLCLWLSNFWINWFSPQARTGHNANQLWNYLLQRNQSKRETQWNVRFLQRNGPDCIRGSRTTLDAALDVLAAHNQITWIDDRSVQLKTAPPNINPPPKFVS